METKINIAEILKDKPQGTKMYSRICGAVELKKVIDVRKKKSIVVKELNSNNQHRFWYDGNFFRAGQCVLQPSENMADWSKFSWKKGDVLVSNDGKCKVIFERFDDDTYTSFVGKYYVECYGKNDELQDYEEEHYGDTVNYTKESEEAALAYINTIEKRLGGKLNHETLEIEKQTEFKDGDIVVTDAVPSMCYSKCIFILKGDLNTGESRANSYVFFNINNNHISYDVLDTIERERNIHLATNSEKQQLFDALAKEGKAWDVEKKKIVGLPPKFDELKPFDKVLVRDDKEDLWFANIFSYRHRDMYYCLGECYRYCIPYEGNEKLLGTMDDVSEKH